MVVLGYKVTSPLVLDLSNLVILLLVVWHHQYHYRIHVLD